MGDASDGDLGWAVHPDAHPDAIERRVVLPEVTGPVGPTQVVEVGAICDIRSPESDDARTQSFDVSEFVRLDDGTRVMLHHDRGFTTWSNSGAIRDSESAASITQTVLNVVLPDEDHPADSHPWSWLAELAQIQGVNVTADDLRRLPYEVVLTDKLISWLAET